LGFHNSPEKFAGQPDGDRFLSDGVTGRRQKSFQRCDVSDRALRHERLAPGRDSGRHFHERKNLGLSRLDESKFQFFDPVLQIHTGLQRQQLLPQLRVVVTQRRQTVFAFLDLPPQLDDLILLVNVPNGTATQEQTNHHGPHGGHKPDG
jgi:hypothetical protein